MKNKKKLKLKSIFLELILFILIFIFILLLIKYKLIYINNSNITDITKAAVIIGLYEIIRKTTKELYKRLFKKMEE